MRYIVRVSGANLMIQQDIKNRFGRKRTSMENLGLVTTRIVAASNVAEASELAIASARQELESSSMPILNLPSDPPIFWIEEIHELATDDARESPKGFIFFREERTLQ